MKTIGNPTLQRCFDAMIANESIILSEQQREGMELAEFQTINSIESSGDITLFDSEWGVIYDININDILIVAQP